MNFLFISGENLISSLMFSPGCGIDAERDVLQVVLQPTSATEVEALPDRVARHHLSRLVHLNRQSSRLPCHLVIMQTTLQTYRHLQDHHLPQEGRTMSPVE